MRETIFEPGMPSPPHRTNILSVQESFDKLRVRLPNHYSPVSIGFLVLLLFICQVLLLHHAFNNMLPMGPTVWVLGGLALMQVLALWIGRAAPRLTLTPHHLIMHYPRWLWSPLQTEEIPLQTILRVRLRSSRVSSGQMAQSGMIILDLIGGDEREIVTGMDNKALQEAGRIIWATIEDHQDQPLPDRGTSQDVPLELVQIVTER